MDDDILKFGFRYANTRDAARVLGRTPEALRRDAERRAKRAGTPGRADFGDGIVAIKVNERGHWRYRFPRAPRGERVAE